MNFLQPPFGGCTCKCEVMKVKFVESPTGRFGLSYFVGDTVDVDAADGQRYIDEGFAVLVDDGRETVDGEATAAESRETATSKVAGKRSRRRKKATEE